MPPLLARSAPASTSIWRDLDEPTFRAHLVSLEVKCNAVPLPPTVHSHNHSEEHMHSHTLTPKREQQTADDFAYIAAVNEGAQSVAAVCIEETLPRKEQPEKKTPRITLRIAGLDSQVDENVKVALNGICEVITRIASDISTGEKNVKEIFHRIVTFHRYRITGYLRSNKWIRPKHLLLKHTKPLWKDFANLIHRVQFLYTRKEKQRRQMMEASIKALAQLYEEHEECEGDQVAHLENLVKASYYFCIDEYTNEYINRLLDSIVITPTSQVTAAINHYRQLEKIAAYYRIAISFTDSAMSYTNLFSNGIAIEYLEPYERVPTTIAHESWAYHCHIHAEVQLAVYYDLQPKTPLTNLRPRCIGTSKWLCFLCYSFLGAHGDFFVSKTHGRLYDQWTIPDLDGFSDDIVAKYRRVIASIDAEVLGMMDNVVWRPEPLTCRQDFDLVERLDMGLGDRLESLKVLN